MCYLWICIKTVSFFVYFCVLFVEFSLQNSDNRIFVYFNRMVSVGKHT